MLNFGFHVSTGGDLTRAPFLVKEKGGECFQFFSRSPYGGKSKPVSREEANLFKENCKKAGIENYYIHAPYFINLASQNNRIYYGSIKAIQEDLEKVDLLGAKGLVTHLGSAKDFFPTSPLFSSSQSDRSLASPVTYGEVVKLSQEENIPPEAIVKVISGLQKISEGKKSIPLIIEIAAGSGAILGASLPEINFYLKAVPAVLGFCFDTAHAFAAGYDLSAKEKRKEPLTYLEEKMGKEKLKLVHLNDSKGGLGEKKDRHAHLGEGLLGKDFFAWLVDYFSKENYNVDMILETPTEEGIKRDLELLKSYRKNSAC